MSEIKFTHIMPDGWEILCHPDTNRIGISLGQNGNPIAVFINLKQDQVPKLIEDLQISLNELKGLQQ